MSRGGGGGVLGPWLVSWGGTWALIKVGWGRGENNCFQMSEDKMLGPKLRSVTPWAAAVQNGVWAMRVEEGEAKRVLETPAHSSDSDHWVRCLCCHASNLGLDCWMKCPCCRASNLGVDRWMKCPCCRASNLGVDRWVRCLCCCASWCETSNVGVKLVLKPCHPDCIFCLQAWLSLQHSAAFLQTWATEIQVVCHACGIFWRWTLAALLCVKGIDWCV